MHVSTWTNLSYLDISISMCMLLRSMTRDAFNFNMVNFPYMSSNIPANRPFHVKHKRIQYCRNERDVTAGVHSSAILVGICIAFN